MELEEILNEISRLSLMERNDDLTENGKRILAQLKYLVDLQTQLSKKDERIKELERITSNVIPHLRTVFDYEQSGKYADDWAGCKVFIIESEKLLKDE